MQLCPNSTRRVRPDFVGDPDFRTKFQREVPLLLEITEFPFNTVYIGPVEKSSHAKTQLDSFIRFSRTPTCDGQTDRQTDTGPWLVPRMLSIAR